MQTRTTAVFTKVIFCVGEASDHAQRHFLLEYFKFVACDVVIVRLEGLHQTMNGPIAGRIDRERLYDRSKEQNWSDCLG